MENTNPTIGAETNEGAHLDKKASLNHRIRVVTNKGAHSGKKFSLKLNHERALKRRPDIQGALDKTEFSGGFTGRTRRKDFCFKIIRITCLEFVISILLPFVLGVGGLIVIPIVVLVFEICKIPVSVRRCHDIGFSGWWYLLVALASLVTFPFGGGIIWFIFFLALLFVDGTCGPNKYGQDPKGLCHERMRGGDNIIKEKDEKIS